MKHLHQFLLIGVFLLLLVLPVMNDVVGVVHFDRLDENRKFRDSLALNIAKLDAFPKDCEAYIADNFSFRTPLITFFRTLKYDLYSVSPLPDQLIVGLNGRHFMAGEEKKIYEGEMNFNEQDLELLEKEWLIRKHYFDSLGIKVYFMPCPTSLEIYPEDLPQTIRKAYPFNRFDQLERRFSRRLPGVFVNLVPVLKAGKKQGAVYFKLDHHWTPMGGYLATKELLGRMKRECFPQLDLSYLSQYSWHEENRNYGHFARLLGRDDLLDYFLTKSGYEDRAEEAPDYELSFPAEGVDPAEKQQRFLLKKPTNKLKILVIRDSFGYELVPFIKEAFSESLFIFDAWNYELNTGIIEAYRPDVVVYETYDPNLWKYINSTQ